MRAAVPVATFTQASMTRARAIGFPRDGKILAQRDRRPGARQRLGRYRHKIIQPRGAQILQIEPAYHEHHAMLVDHGGVGQAGVAQGFGAGAFGKPQIGGVIHDAAGVGVLIIDTNVVHVPDHEALSRRSGLNRSGCSGSGAGGVRPRWRQPRSPSMRPRLVRSTKPSWIRNGSMTSSSVSRASERAAARVSTPTGPPAWCSAMRRR